MLASEAYWGVAAHALQAVAERHGIKHSTNLDFKRAIEWLITETGDNDLNGLFQRTYYLHRNFYQIVMTPEEVRENSQHALRLADQIRTFA